MSVTNIKNKNISQIDWADNDVNYCIEIGPDFENDNYVEVSFDDFKVMSFHKEIIPELVKALEKFNR
jgi:hypothetical protein